MHLDRSSNKGSLSGKINIVQGPMSLKAEKVEFNLGTQGFWTESKSNDIFGRIAAGKPPLAALR